MKLRELADRLGCALEGSGDVEIVGVAPIESAEPHEVTFVANPRYRRCLDTTRAGAVIVGPGVSTARRPVLRAADPYAAFARAIEIFYRPPAVEPGVHPTAVVAPTATVGPGAAIGPFVVIGERVRLGSGARLDAHVVIYPDAIIGDRFVAHAHVVVREGVRIGNDVILHAGVVVGSDGFGYVPDPTTGGVRKLPQAGTVIIEDGVEVGANTTIDRATVGATRVRRGAKLDNLVMVAHGCDIGEGSLLAAQVGLSGSTRLGRGVRMGGQAGAAGHLSIGDGAQVAAQSGVANSVGPGAVVGGYPAVDIRLWRRISAAAGRLPDLVRRVRRLELRLEAERGGNQS